MPNQRPIIPITVLITIVVIAILMVGVAWWYKTNQTGEKVSCSSIKNYNTCKARPDCMPIDPCECNNQYVQAEKCGLPKPVPCLCAPEFLRCEKLTCPSTNTNTNIATTITLASSIKGCAETNKGTSETTRGILTGSETPRQASISVDGNTITYSRAITHQCCRKAEIEKTIDGSAINIYEVWSGDGCRCMCFSEISATLSNVPGGTYTVNVYEKGTKPGTNELMEQSLIMRESIIMSGPKVNINTNTVISQDKQCTQDSDCGLLLCGGCYSKEYLKTAPPDLPCREYDGYACQCVKNRCLEIRPDRPYDFPSIRDEANCLALSAEWVSVGKMMRCEMPAPDAGKTCTKASDCIRYCSLENVNDATGTCSAHSGTSCYRFLDEDGKLGMICVD